MEREKQIEEMACDMCGNKDFCPINPNVCISYGCNLHSAKMLLDRGCRKETETIAEFKELVKEYLLDKGLYLNAVKNAMEYAEKKMKGE